MKMNKFFNIGQKYTISGKEVECVIIKTFKGIQIATLEDDKQQFKITRWPDGEVNRVTRN